jgi:hypothetical protein
MTGKLVVGFPLYHQVPAPFFTRWMNIDKSPLVGSITVNGAYITTSCEVMVREALGLMGLASPCPSQGGHVKHLIPPTSPSAIDYDVVVTEPSEARIEWDRLVIIEHDVLLPVDALVRIAHYDPDADIVGSMVFEHGPPHSAIVFIEDDEGHLDAITPQTVKAWTDEPMLYRCDATSFGCISIHRRVLENWDADIPMFGIDHVVGSHDLWFTRKARAQGFKVFVDSGMVAEHLTTAPVGLSHNQDSAYLVDRAAVREFVCGV